LRMLRRKNSTVCAVSIGKQQRAATGGRERRARRFDVPLGLLSREFI
jgi:hypothetical protein